MDNMTLDEAIIHCEEVAEENQRVIDTGIVFNDVTIDMLYCDDTEVIKEHLANYKRCAEEQRQFAEWLKELKQLREQAKWIPVSERLPEEEGFISKREAIKMFTYNYKGERIPDYDCDNFPVQIDIKTVKKILRDLPPVNLQPKTGHWIAPDGDNAICGCCNRLNHLYGTYCKHCGAKMYELQESEK